MAKTENVRKEDTLVEQPTLPTVGASQEAQLPAELLAEMEQDAGRGFSQNREDSVTPLIVVLQDLSPQVKPRDPAYIEGATAGDFYISATGRVIKGSDGIVVIPSGFRHEYVEWRPRDAGGGIAGRHAIGDLPEDAREEEDRNGKLTLRRQNGNDLIETRYHYVVFEGQAYVIPFKSTGHQASKRWTFLMSSKRLPSGKPAPAWSHRYKLTTQLQKNVQGEWYGIQTQDSGNPTRDEYILARALANAVDSGNKVVDSQAESEMSSKGGDIPF